METDKSKRREIKYVVGIEYYNKLHLWIKKIQKALLNNLNQDL